MEKEKCNSGEIRQVRGTKFLWGNLFSKENYGLFKAEKGEAISFYVNLLNVRDKNNYAKLIELFGGRLEQDLDNIDGRTIVLVDGSFPYKGYSFKVDFIVDCITENTLLDLSKYVQNRPRGLSASDDPLFMKIVYWRTSVFPSLKEQETRTSPPRKDPNDSDSASSTDSFLVASQQSMATQCCNTLNKHTRKPYSRREQAAILKYIVSKKAFTLVKGNKLYKDMEKKEVCPGRTFQSMRNHFLKTIVMELDTFQFLSPKDKQLLRNKY